MMREDPLECKWPGGITRAPPTCEKAPTLDAALRSHHSTDKKILNARAKLVESVRVLLLPLSERSVISYQVLQLAQVTSSYVARQMEKMLPSM